MSLRIDISLTRGQAAYLFNLLEGMELRQFPYLNRPEYGNRNKEILQKLKFAADHRIKNEKVPHQFVKESGDKSVQTFH
jgi:hypothetical protein